jgi:hypothetical protein
MNSSSVIVAVEEALEASFEEVSEEEETAAEDVLTEDVLATERSFFVQAAMVSAIPAQRNRAIIFFIITDPFCVEVLLIVYFSKNITAFLL